MVHAIVRFISCKTDQSFTALISTPTMASTLRRENTRTRLPLQRVDLGIILEACQSNVLQKTSAFT